jgi:hypothetical protein
MPHPSLGLTQSADIPLAALTVIQSPADDDAEADVGILLENEWFYGVVHLFFFRCV